MFFNNKKKYIHDSWEENENSRLYRHKNIIVKTCEFGLGVFTLENIKKDEIIEECHYLQYYTSHCQSPIINDYVFGVEKSNKNQSPELDENALVLGYGSIFNHSNQNNASYYLDTNRNLFTFYAITNIIKNSQIYINYGKEWWESRNQKKI